VMYLKYEEMAEPVYLHRYCHITKVYTENNDSFQIDICRS